ncbi:outer arm dynein light chain 1, partial [Gonapodya prolifera JEL478]
LTASVLERGAHGRRAGSESTEKFLSRVSQINLGGFGLDELSDALALCPALDTLHIYANALASSTVSPLHHLRSLTHLHIQDNLLTTTLPLGCLKKLRWLDVSGNRIARVEGLSECAEMETLRVERQQGVESVELEQVSFRGMARTLTDLSLASNALTNLHAFTHLTELKALDLSNTNIADWETLTTLLSRLFSLTNLRLLSTPLQATTPSHAYRARVVLTSGPKLASLDGKNVVAAERLVWERKRAREEQVERKKLAGEGGPAEAASEQAQEVEREQEPAPVPHLPPYATQYRDMLIHKLAHASSAPSPSSSHAHPRSGSKPAPPPGVIPAGTIPVPDMYRPLKALHAPKAGRKVGSRGVVVERGGGVDGV